MEINPHRFPCMYSATLEDNAVTSLASISESLDYPDMPPSGSGVNPPVRYQGVKEAWSLWKPPYTKPTSQNWTEPEVKLSAKTRSATDVKQTTSLSDLVSSDDVVRPVYVASQTRQATSRPTRLTGVKREEMTWADSSVKEESPVDSCGHRLPGRCSLKRQQMMSPWKTCSYLHPLEQLYFRSVSPVYRQRLSASYRQRRARSTSSAQRRTAATGRAVGSYNNIDTIQKFLKWRPSEGGQKRQNKPSSSVKTKSGSAPTKLPSGEKQEKQRVGLSPVPAGHYTDIPFKFEHHRSHRSYMRHYKAGHTYRKLYPTFSSCSPSTQPSKTDISTDTYQPSKVDIQCSDLQDRAHLKVSLFHFKVKQPQTHTIVDTITKDDEKTQPPSPSPKSASSLLLRPSSGVLGMTLPGSNATSAPVTSSSRGSVSPPVVCRSRPSIPSNHRGVVCPTAVETPGHVVRRMGRLEWGQRLTCAKSKIDHASLQIQGRNSAKNVGIKLNKKLG